jgi:hypothetical protein
VPRVHRQVATVGSHVQRGRVVVVALEAGVQYRPCGSPSRDVVRDDFDVAVAGRATRAARVGDRADQQRAGIRVDDGPFVLEPRPPAVVVEHHRVDCRDHGAEPRWRPWASNHRDDNGQDRRDRERVRPAPCPSRHCGLPPAARAIRPRAMAPMSSACDWALGRRESAAASGRPRPGRADPPATRAVRS